MPAFVGLTQIDATYLKSIDSFENNTLTKIWGPLNKNSTLQNIDAATRALCSLSKNTYNDTILQAILNYNGGNDNNPIGGNNKQLQIRVATVSPAPYKSIDKTVWSGYLNPEKSHNDIINAIGDNSSQYAENQLFHLVDRQKFEIELQTNNIIYYGRSTAEISVTEYLAM